VRQNAERFCVGWTHWEYADGFGFVRRKNGVETLDSVIGSALIDAHQ
jgi:endoglucanase